MGYSGTVYAGGARLFHEPKERSREACLKYAAAVEATRPVRFDEAKAKAVTDWIVERAEYARIDSGIIRKRIDEGRFDASEGATKFVEVTDKLVKEMGVITIVTEAKEIASGRTAHARVEPIGEGFWSLVLTDEGGAEIWRSEKTDADPFCVRPLHGDVCWARAFLTKDELGRFDEAARLVTGRSKSKELERIVKETLGDGSSVAIDGGY